MLDFISRQLVFIEVQKATEARCSTAILIDKLSIEIYEIQFFRADFHPIRVYMFGFSFLTTLNIYKDYFNDHQRLRKCEAKFCSCKFWSKTEFALIHLSLEEVVMFVHRRILWPTCFLIFIVLINWRTLQPTSFSSWWLSRVLGSAHLLVSNVLGAVHWKWKIVTTKQVQLGIRIRVQL